MELNHNNNKMNQKAIIKCCKELGCCDACCIRFLGLKSPTAYENAQQFVLKIINEETPNPLQDVETKPPASELTDDPSKEQLGEVTPAHTAHARDEVADGATTATAGAPVAADSDLAHTREKGQEDPEAPPAKKLKGDDVCVSCIGVLQPKNWPECYSVIKDVLDKKQYACESFACALSAPVAAMLREHWAAMQLNQTMPGYDYSSVTPLKEAWKWSFGARLGHHVGKALHSGATSPLLVTLTLDYDDDEQELEVLRQLAPAQFSARDRQRRRFGSQVTRRAAEQALAGVGGAGGAAAWRAAGWAAPPAPRAPPRPRAAAAHSPIWLGGRYVKNSRTLPQTPWLVAGRRMMPSSVQEIICGPIAALYKMSAEDAENRLKFMSAGREDVDVRCLGDGRPFAIEISDPNRQPTEAELSEICKQISAEGQVIVRRLVPVSREDLALLKKGEETKCKTYEALCIKLTHAAHDEPVAAGAPPVVTERDIAALNAYGAAHADGVELRQRTPIRVLHRRALCTRARRVLAVRARAVPARPQLFALRVRAAAGTYVKEWAHGELGRTRPRLADALGARADILALDVAAVHLPWPTQIN